MKTATIRINRLTQTISFKTEANLPFEKKQRILFVASASSRLPVTFRSSNPRIILINNNKAFIVGRGKVEITAMQVGNWKYTRAPKVIREIKVE